MEVNLKKKNTGLIAGIAAVVVVLAIVLVMVFSGGNKDDPLQKQLDLGKKYMQEMNYEQAIAAYLAAIEIDDKCIEAYLGAAKAYEAMGDIDSAVDILSVGFDITGDSQLEDLLTEILSGESQSNGNMDETSGYGEGAVYVVEFEDPELTQIAQEFYQMVLDNPEDPAGYGNLVDMYLGLDQMQAAVDVAKAGYNKTGEEFFKEVIEWVENGGPESSNDDTVVEEEQPKEPEAADNSFIVNGYNGEYYQVTYDPNYIEPRKEGKMGWIHFDGNGVQINFNKQNYASFEEYFAADKANFDFLIEDSYIRDLELSTPVEVQCGNVTAYYYEYSYIDISDKVVEPTEYRTQEFYVQLGDGVGVSGTTDKFLDGYLYTAVGEQGRTITMEDYLKYVFVNVEKIEAADAQ